jgi:ribosome-binding protein aMBF1 (putative translation factor)
VYVADKGCCIVSHSYLIRNHIKTTSLLYHFAISLADDPRQDLARRVRSLRHARFLSQDELSESSGVGRATIARIELGHTVPHARTIRSLAAALGVQPGDLVEDPGRLWRRAG